MAIMTVLLRVVIENCSKSDFYLELLKFSFQFSSLVPHLISELMQRHLLLSPSHGKHHCPAMGKFKITNCTTWKKGLIKNRYKTTWFFWNHWFLKPKGLEIQLSGRTVSCLACTDVLVLYFTPTPKSSRVP